MRAPKNNSNVCTTFVKVEPSTSLCCPQMMGPSVVVRMDPWMVEGMITTFFCPPMIMGPLMLPVSIMILCPQWDELRHDFQSTTINLVHCEHME